MLSAGWKRSLRRRRLSLHSCIWFIYDFGVVDTRMFNDLLDLVIMSFYVLCCLTSALC